MLHLHLPLDMGIFALLNLPYQHTLGDRAMPYPTLHQRLDPHELQGAWLSLQGEKIRRMSFEARDVDVGELQRAQAFSPLSMS